MQGRGEASAKGAVLQGNSTVLGIQHQVRALLGGVQSVSGSYSTLSQLGISFQKDGGGFRSFRKAGNKTIELFKNFDK